MFQYVTMCYNMLQKTNHCVTKPVTASDLPALAGSFPVEALSWGKDYRCQANYAFDLDMVLCSVPLPQFFFLCKFYISNYGAFYIWPDFTIF